MVILGIETSCDETAAAVLSEEKLLSSVISTQDIHRKYGGVVPELASREHLKGIVPVVEEAFTRSGTGWRDLDAVAVTRGPGLIGSLLIGVSFAKSAGFAREIPVIGVNHIEAHLWAPVFENPGLKPPFTGLIISGGHTQLWHVREFGDYILMGQTLDDAVGEAFDKVAQMLGLEYPGGPVIDRLSREGNPEYHRFPRSKIKHRPFDFSFSGLKTSVLYFLEKLSDEELLARRADIAASFQQAVVDTLIEKTVKAAKKMKSKTIITGGGVAANSALKLQLTDEAKKHGISVCSPSPVYCTDNAAMIAYVGSRRLGTDGETGLDFSPDPSLKLSHEVYKGE